MKLFLISKSIEGAPPEFQVLPYGQIDIEGEKPAHLDEEAMASIIADFERRGNDMVIDYEHQTLDGVQAPAAGWIKKFIEKGKDGLWAVVEWTEKAKQYLTTKEYRYFSPVFWKRKGDGKIVKIENIALTNFPKLNNLRPIIAKMTREQAREAQQARAKKYKISVKEGGNVTKPGEWENVPDDQFLDPVNYRYPCPDADQTRAAAGYWGKPKNQAQYSPAERSIINERLDRFRKKFNIGEFRKEAKMFEKLKKLLGLADDAGEDAVFAAAEKMVNKNKELGEKGDIIACKEVLEAIGATGEDNAEQVVAKLKGLREAETKKTDIEAELVTLKKNHDDLKRKWDERTADELIAKAIGKGQMTPAQATGWGRDMALRDPENFKRVVLTRREFSEVPLEKLPENDDKGGGTPQEKMDRLIAKKMKEDKDLAYADAMNQVAAENPDLADEYIQAGRAK